MKVLFAPLNIASMPSITAQAINRTKVHQAVCLTINNHKYTEGADCVRYTPFTAGRSNPILFLFQRIRFILELYRLLKWCDVVHWTWDSVFPFKLDLKLIVWMKKKRFVEWVGSDIRIPEVTMKESKWYEYAYYNGYEYAAVENRKQSHEIQHRFASFGFVPVLVPEMQLFLVEGLFPKVYTTQYRIDCSHSFQAKYPELQNDSILIVHSPSAKIAKGSNIIVPVVESLQKEYPNINFRLLHNVSRAEVLKVMRDCDIFIDQIVLGSYAAAAIEAMSFGKPVLAYIMPSVYKKGVSKDCPIVNVTADSLKENLEKLVLDPAYRRQIGINGRSFAEKVHDADVLAKQLLIIYNN